MASTTYAAIHVGSNELCMKIYEMSRQNGIRQLTYVRHRSVSVRNRTPKESFPIRHLQKSVTHLMISNGL